MEYYVVLTVSYNDTTDTKKSIYSVANKTEGLKMTYQLMASYVGLDNVASVCVISISSVGNIYRNEVWVNPIIPTTESIDSEVIE